jgi:hypothetical protein
MPPVNNLIEEDIQELMEDVYDELYGEQFNSEQEFHRMKYLAMRSSMTEPCPSFSHVEKAMLQYYNIKCFSELKLSTDNKDSFERFIRALYNDVVIHGAYTQLDYNTFKAYHPDSA